MVFLNNDNKKSKVFYPKNKLHKLDMRQIFTYDYMFDLDDTLYDENKYVESGFRAVSKYLSDLNILRISKNKIFTDLIEILNLNGKVIDIFLKKNKITQKI